MKGEDDVAESHSVSHDVPCLAGPPPFVSDVALPSEAAQFAALLPCSALAPVVLRRFCRPLEAAQRLGVNARCPSPFLLTKIAIPQMFQQVHLCVISLLFGELRDQKSQA